MQGVHRDRVVGDLHRDVEDRLGPGLRQERRQVATHRDRRGAGELGSGAGGVEVEVDDADELDVRVGGDGAEPGATHAAGADLHDPQRGVHGHARASAVSAVSAAGPCSSASGASSSGASSNGPR